MSMCAINFQYFTRHPPNLTLSKELYVSKEPVYITEKRMCSSFWNETAFVKRYTYKHKTVGVKKKCSNTHNTPLSLGIGTMMLTGTLTQFYNL
jgi:hypothetical protein